jgi:hypothetical protein
MITTRQELADYAIRQVGGGVINIEVSPEQVEDVIDSCIQFFREYHYDGCERDYLVLSITATKLTVDASTGFQVKDIITGSTSGSTAMITEIVGDVITVSRQGTPGVRFTATETITNGTATTDIVSRVEGTIDTQSFPTDDTIMGVNRILNVNSIMATNYLFNPQYQFMINELQNLVSGQTQYLYGFMSYLSHLDFILRKEKSFRFNRYKGKLQLDINWDIDVSVGDKLVADVFRYIDDTTYSKLLNDIWLKKYVTANIKKIWASNTKKYSGMTLPGGMTFNGQQAYDEAVREIAELEEQAMNQEPLGFLIG